MLKTIIDTDIRKAIDLLNANEVVAIPTETVYGLAANALSEEAVVKIFEAKQRPFFNPLIVHVSSIDEIDLYAEMDEISRKLASCFMPGPLTLLLPKKELVPGIVTAGSTKVAIRVPQHHIAKSLLQQLDFPIAAPSANPFGYVSPVTAKHVYDGLNGKIHYILDGGNSNVGVESTIIEVENEQVILHRVGGLAIEEIENVIGIKLIRKKTEKNPTTSGQLKSHYATTTDLIQGNIQELLQQHSSKKIAIISFKKQYPNIADQDQYILSKEGSLQIAAQNLFHVMRILDEKDYNLILTEIFPNEGLGVAINDRLYRAQSSQKS
ncbi:MAG: threonylcarbamoyl-AMP synthase [Chitinophagaceae bacterium]|nr:threonylcarbamoyl-AMP synthase [Chitinophagaceae bacterium]